MVGHRDDRRPRRVRARCALPGTVPRPLRSLALRRRCVLPTVLALGFLCGPLRRPGWRAAIASISKEKAGETRRQVAAIAESSGLDVRIRRSPYPGTIESATGSLDTLSADRTAGHAAGYDLVIVDETGLLPERARDLLAGLRSSVSARRGKIRHISIRGDSPLIREILLKAAVPSMILLAGGSLQSPKPRCREMPLRILAGPRCDGVREG